MKLRLLPSSFEADGTASPRQHSTCFVVDSTVAIDAGSLANAADEAIRAGLRDIVLTHAHLDHIAGLPLFIDDLFSILETPVRVHAMPEVIEILERDIFNWSVYPRFSELNNERGPVMEYVPLGNGHEHHVAHLTFRPIPVNHKVPSNGFAFSDGRSVAVISGDTAEMDGFWEIVNGLERLDALLIECAFPDRLGDLALISHHLTPSLLAKELAENSTPSARLRSKLGFAPDRSAKVTIERPSGVSSNTLAFSAA
ncbi:MBL fold metallo-hydrolase [Leptolyngbya sp. 7M]|uniref:MBL fold metallo-hydrolase n=1 Tax=Leptolyngbya sp. 7M TaxID=2812896 RepID=UPI0021F1D018|nr:3',5'-cyclic-nucleotide phosphodiesterase [Leptolyngbya sp. 7M]